MLNKKGHIGTTLLVFGALILMVLTLFTFVSFDDEVEARMDLFKEIHKSGDFESKLLERGFKVFISGEILNLKNSLNFEDDFKKSFEKYAGKKRGKLDTNFYGKIVNGDYKFIEDKGNYTLILEDLFLKKETDKIVMKKNFGFVVEFDRKMIKKFEKTF